MAAIATTMMSKVAVVTVAAVGLYIPTLGLPLAGWRCLRSVGIAGAAPSPSCASDLRECLRRSADMRQTTFGGRYVTAEDVARCVEAFNACIHGGAGAGGDQAPGSRPPDGRPTTTQTNTGTQGAPGTGSNPAPPSGSPGSTSGKALPQRFAMAFQGFVNDCRVTGEKVTCTTKLEPVPPGIDFFEATFTGTLSQTGATGTEMRSQKGHYDNGCTFDENYSTPYSYYFNSDGSVTLKFGTGQRQSRFSCAEATTGTTPPGEITGTWSPTR